MRRKRRPPEFQRRLVAATAASAATGTVVYLIVIRVLLPMIVTRLTSSHVAWLRQAFAQHPAFVLATIVLAAAVLALPVLGVFRWVSGPWRGR